ncbi:hypothetical protein [Nocardia sp. NPDC005366]|uniref:hypothetical protein n=1 Tax=Nocardia sp. NPDC005366 TaxID=3156878 RepID=UPI0033A4ECA5
MFDRWVELAQQDPDLVHRGRYVTAVVLVDRLDDSFVLSIRDGLVLSIEPKPRVMPEWTLTLRAPAGEWAAFWQPEPAPGSHDLMALLRRRVLVVEGNLHPFMANLRYFKDILEIPRRKEVLA